MLFRNYSRIILMLLFGLALPFLGAAQSSFFSNAPETVLKATAQKQVIIPEKYRTLKLDTSALLSFLKTVPSEKAANFNRNTTAIIALPMPDGSTASFRIWESAVMAPELAARYPNLKTFTGQGITDATATLKLDWTEQGFHAQILSPVTTAIYINPYAHGTLTGYISYYKKDLKKKESYTELPPIQMPGSANRVEVVESTQCIGTQLRTYRLAVACTGEYAVAATGLPTPTKAQALSAIVTTVNRVNGIYEKELALRMVLVATEDNVVFTNAATDPFTGNNNANVLISESQTVIDLNIGTANYDMGHTFSTGGGGLSGLGIICIAGQKAQSITGSPSPTGDGYDVDYVAHEMGHAVGANHTFNSVLSACSGNGSSTTNTEPGSGSTIMAYAGICAADDLQPHSDPQFNAASLDEISTYTFLGTGNTCGTLTSTGNTPPVVNAGANYIIPKSTPFILTGSATDANGDPLTYSWEEIDFGGPFGPWNTPSGNAPLFRSFIPSTSPTRYFPKLSDVINNTTTIGEILPSYARTVRFRLTARDNRAGGGGVCFDSTSLLVDGTAAPFAVTVPTATGIVWYVNDFKYITWDASTTAAAPINCANVTIQLSLDGGNTFPITLLASTPNDGLEEIQVPNNLTTTARIRVMALGNVFYDISNNNFTIQNSPIADFTFNYPQPVVSCGSNAPAMVLKSGAYNGFSNSISLSFTGVPAGTNITTGANPITPGSSTTVTLNNANSLASGNYDITVTGTASGVGQKTRVLRFTINSTLPAPTLVAPAANAVGVSTNPAFSWSAVAGALSYTLEISTVANFSSITQSVTGITTTSYNLVISLALNTVYYWRVKMVNGCGTGSPSAGFMFTTGTLLPAITVAATAGTPGPTGYTTLKTAFDAINAGTHQGTITISVNDNSDEGTTPAVLNASGTGAASYTGITISPAGGGARTITGNIPAGSPLIDFNGADAVTINGLNAGGNSLTISNTSTGTTAGTSTIRFIADASANFITNCTILGSSASALSTAAGTVLFSTGIATGNDLNIVSNCNIGPAGASLPSKALMASGTSAAIENDLNLITGNNIFDFFLPTGSTSGINILTGNETWLITNNRFYQTAPRTFTTTASRYAAVTLNNSTGTFVVSGNTIGFGTANGTGTTTIAGLANECRGIDVASVNTTATTTIANNIISGIDQTTSRNSTSSLSAAFIGIAMGTTDGLITATGNTIGSLNGSSTIVLNCSSTTASTAAIIGLFNFSNFPTIITDNNIGSITIQGTGTTTGFIGIYVNTKTATAATISNNKIANITNNQVGSYNMTGIRSSLPDLAATGNVIRNFTGNAFGSGLLVATGIQATGSTGINVISQNSIHSLANNAGSGTGLGGIYGMTLALPATANIVERNFIHSLSLISTGATTQVWGINGGATGTATYRNNMIRLGLDATGSSVTQPSFFVGFRDVAGATNQYYYNSVYIGGSGVLATPTPNSSIAFYSDVVNNTHNIQNNIFWNARGNSAAGGVNHFAIAVAGTSANPPGLTSNYNDLYATGTDGFVGVFNNTSLTTLADWRTATGQDANSLSIDPQFINATGPAATANLHIIQTGSPMNGAGTPVAGITTDYDAETRNAVTPDIGADEVFLTSSPADYFRSITTGNWNAPATWESATNAGFTTGVVSPATLSPDLNASAITVRNSHTVTVTADVTIRNTTVSPGGSVIVNANIVLTVK